MAFYGRPSLPFASPKTLQTPKTPKRPLPWLLMGFQRRQKLPQGQIHCFFWAVQRAVGQAFAANRHPKATSMAFSRRPSLPFASPKTLQKPLKGHFNGFLWASSAGKSPHPWLFMGVQACRLPALKPSKPLKPVKGHFNGFLWASSAGKSPHPWLFMGVQACRLPALKRSKNP